MRAEKQRGFRADAARQHVLILASGEKIRHLHLKPWMLAIFVGVAFLGLGSYFGATAYLVLRDQLIGASMARQARLQYDYEDRIAALRAQVDRVTSRQLLDQQVVEDKLEKLLESQMALSARSGKLGNLLERAEQSGLDAQTTQDIPVAQTHAENARPKSQGPVAAMKGILSFALRGVPDDQPSNDGSIPASGLQVAAASAPRPVQAVRGFVQPGAMLAATDETVGEHADRVFQNVTLSLKAIERQQAEKIRNLTTSATVMADNIEDVLSRTGIKIDSAEEGKDAMGGPMVEADPHRGFDTSLDGLDQALSRLSYARDMAHRMPFINPGPSNEITSPFGNRPDPFFGRLAMHTGVDFRAQTGAPIKSAGGGTVTTAGVVNGYGNMVEIDHGDGIATRYGHMSKILVQVGDKVTTGSVIGLAGSTGRSTGTHLHYEVRRDGVPVDPMRFLTAGLKLESLLE